MRQANSASSSFHWNPFLNWTPHKLYAAASIIAIIGCSRWPQLKYALKYLPELSSLLMSKLKEQLRWNSQKSNIDFKCSSKMILRFAYRIRMLKKFKIANEERNEIMQRIIIACVAYFAAILLKWISRNFIAKPTWLAFVRLYRRVTVQSLIQVESFNNIYLFY